MTVALIDYGSGNLHSALKAFERAADGREQIALTSDPDIVRRADRVVLPGVGAFADCKRGLEAVPGMVEALTEAVITQRKPFLGICVGMQLMATRGLEHGEHKGLGWIAGDVVALTPSDKTLKVPHMGWNNLRARHAHPLLDGVATGDKGLHAYFVHSYHFVPRDNADILATVDYGGDVVAMVARDNIVGTQFHPEKSQKLGLALIANFLRWRP